MAIKTQNKISASVAKAAGDAVLKRGFATAIDVFIGLGWLKQKDLLSWKKGEVLYLERVVNANLNRISQAMKEFRAWSVKAQLKPSATVYKHKSHTLQFSKSGHEGIEAAYRTHFVLPRKSPSTESQMPSKKGKNCLPPFAENASLPLAVCEHEKLRVSPFAHNVSP